LYSLYEVSLEVIVVKTVPHHKKTRSALDAIVGQIAMFVEGRLVALSVLIETWRYDEAVHVQVQTAAPGVITALVPVQTPVRL
jgi:hypothetical protein